MSVVRIATWNVNGLRARLDFLLHWLGARQPDVIGLQELKLPDDQFPHDELAALGYQALVHGQTGWNGVAILAREPLVEIQRGLPGQEEMGARFLAAEVGGLSFATLYTPNGKHLGHEDYPRKLDWLAALADHLGGSSGHLPRVVCGDFNLCPGALDSFDPEGLAGEIFHTDEERGRFRRLERLGLVDLYRHHHPERQAFSWWDYRAGAFHKNLGLRIDLLLGDSAVAARVRSAEIDREYRKKKDGLTASDHAPVIVELEGG